MRYVPNRKLYKLTRKPIWKLTKCYEMKYWNSLEDSLDPTFKWHRLFNQVSYKEQYKGLESYVVVGLYSKRTSRLVNYK
ncbi:hypothetical protein [Bacillus cereus]